MKRKINSALVQISCSICGQKTNTLRRYPLRVCRECVANATDLQGNHISFSNSKNGYGCEGSYVNSQRNYGGHSCYIDCYPCEAQEARFGGIVIEKVDTENTRDLFASEVEGDKNIAPIWYYFRALAEQGDMKGQLHLAKLYFEGKGVTQNYKEAAKWYRKLAEQGHFIAQHSLAMMYHKGQGVERDKKKAAQWYRKWHKGKEKDDQSFYQWQLQINSTNKRI